MLRRRRAGTLYPSSALHGSRSDGESAAPHRRSKKPKAAKKNNNKNNNQLNSMQTHLAADKQAVLSAGQQANQAQDAVDKAAHDLAAIERSLEESQPDDSPFAQAKTHYAAARKRNQAAVDRVLNSPHYQAELVKLPDSGDNRAERLGDLRSQALSNDTEASIAAVELSAARRQYDALHDALLHQDAGWKSAVEALNKLRQDQSTAETALSKARGDETQAENALLEQQRQKQLEALRKQQAQAAKKEAEKRKREQQARRARQN